MCNNSYNSNNSRINNNNSNIVEVTTTHIKYSNNINNYNTNYNRYNKHNTSSNKCNSWHRCNTSSNNNTPVEVVVGEGVVSPLLPTTTSLYPTSDQGGGVEKCRIRRRGSDILG